jgi:hypothetical protein
MKIFVRILCIIASIALTLKFTMIPGGGVLLVLSMSTLAMFFIFFGFAYFNKLGFKQMLNSDFYLEIPQARIFAGIGLGITYGIVITGMLYKFQNWPLGDVHLRTGLVLLIAFFIFHIVKSFKTKSEYNRAYSKQIFLLGLLGIAVFSTSSLTLVKLQYRNHPGYVRAFELYENDPTSENLSENLDIEYHRATLDPEDFKGYLNWLKREEEKKTAFSFLDYPISRGRVGNIKVGTQITSYYRQLKSLKKSETTSYQFGFDGGGIASVYSFKNEPVFALIPALETDSIIAIIVMNENFQSISRVRVGMKAQEVSSLYPLAKIQVNEMMNWEEMYDKENNFSLIFKTKNEYRVGVYTDIEKATSPVNLTPKLDWITVR